MISTALWAVVVFDAGLRMDTVLQVFYFAMAIYGWVQWKRGGRDHTGVSVHWWPLSRHLLAIAPIAVCGLVIGWFMSRTPAEFPYLDSLTTIAAIVATFMVTRKVIENWIYWFVIDAVYIYLYIERDLDGYAALYLLYLLMVVFGFLSWQFELRSGKPVADSDAAD